jgi:hypothetical protein
MTYRFTVEVIGAGKTTILPNLEIGATKRTKAVEIANRWHSKGKTVVIHDHLTGERQILSQ